MSAVMKSSNPVWLTPGIRLAFIVRFSPLQRHSPFYFRLTAWMRGSFIMVFLLGLWRGPRNRKGKIGDLRVKAQIELRALQGKENSLGHEFGIWIRFFLRVGLPLVTRSFTFLQVATNIISSSFMHVLGFLDIRCNFKIRTISLLFFSETIEKKS